MATAEASTEIAAPLADVWELYFDPRRWEAWVDGFGRVMRSEGYPQEGGTLSWQSTPAGRGLVSELVQAHDPRTLHRVAYEDPGSRGRLESRFEMMAAGAQGERRTRVSQQLSYEVLNQGPFGRLTDALFIRTQMRRSLERSLAALRLEAEEVTDSGAPVPEDVG